MEGTSLCPACAEGRSAFLRHTAQPAWGAGGRQASVVRGRGWEVLPSSSCAHVGSCFLSTPFFWPRAHLVLKALGSERPVLGWRVGFPSV